jgi:hypothetical protein
VEVNVTHLLDSCESPGTYCGLNAYMNGCGEWVTSVPSLGPAHIGGVPSEEEEPAVWYLDTVPHAQRCPACVAAAIELASLILRKVSGDSAPPGRST